MQGQYRLSEQELLYYKYRKGVCQTDGVPSTRAFTYYASENIQFIKCSAPQITIFSPNFNVILCGVCIQLQFTRIISIVEI